MANNIYVNMTPNPLDLQRLECSQGDTEERKFQFTLHNQGEVYDLSNISDPVFSSFPVEVGGTEEILPSNGSTPTTSPIKADIQYPDGIREGEEFTYRESPAIQDGLARINKIKGNTLVWNQLVQNGNFASTSNWIANGVTLTVSNNIATYVPTSNGNRFLYFAMPLTIGHKYFYHATLKASALPSDPVLTIYYGGTSNMVTHSLTSANAFQTFTGTFTCVSNVENTFRLNARSTSITYNAKDVMLIDLTQMGLDISSPSEFTSLFPLSYYPYTTGELLDFKGTEIKTVGKNIIDPSYASSTTVNGLTITKNSDGSITVNGTATSDTTYNILPTGATTIPLDAVYYTFNDCYASISRATGVSTSVNASRSPVNFYAVKGDVVTRIWLFFDRNTTYDKTFYPQIERGQTFTGFAPYESQTTSIPTLTYFPTGMKSAGDVYDELTPSKAITRVGSIDLGTLTYTQSATAGNGYRFSVGGAQIPNIKPSTSNSDIMNAVFALGRGVSQSNTYNNIEGVSVSTSGVINIYIEAYKNYTNEQFKSVMSGIMLYYELANESVQSITSASLVTENGEAILYHNGDYLECECNADISSEAGYHVAKIRFTDDDGSNYSNKIQLHVERSPE